MSKSMNALTVFGVVVVVLLLSFWIFWANWMNFVDKHEFGYVFDKFSGNITTVSHSGWVLRNPFRYTVNKIDLRPYQVSITADLGVSQRILNAKLVRFNPAGLNTFIAWHGRGAGSSVDALKEILKCYAFDREEGRDCPFLVVVSEIAPSQSIDVQAGK